MKKYLYVDTENTGLSFIDLVSRMGKSWSVTIFYSAQTPRLSFAEMDLLMNSRCKCRFSACRNGRPNAMDFCIMAKVGMNVEKHPKAMHLILSRDKGYLAGVELLRERGYYVGEIVLDELTRSVSWVSETTDARPYHRVRDFFDSVFALEQLPQGALPDAASAAGAVEARAEQASRLMGGVAGEILKASLEARAGRRRNSRQRSRGLQPGGPISLQALERTLVRIMIEHFDAVGVDRRKKTMGQILRRGLQYGFKDGELKFDKMEPQLRKFAMFRDGDEKLLELLGFLAEVNGLAVTNTEAFYGEKTRETAFPAEKAGAVSDSARTLPDVVRYASDDEIVYYFGEDGRNGPEERYASGTHDPEDDMVPGEDMDPDVDMDLTDMDPDDMDPDDMDPDDMDPDDDIDLDGDTDRDDDMDRGLGIEDTETEEPYDLPFT